MKLIVIFSLLILNPLYCIDFEQLVQHLSNNSIQLTIKKLDVDISNEDLNIINSEYYPTLSFGFNIENSKLLNNNLNSTSVGDNSLTTDSFKKSYSYINLNYNIYSFGRLDNKIKNQKYLIDGSKYEYCLEKKNLLLQLLEKYNDMLNNQIKRKYLKRIINEKNKIYIYQKKLYESGNVSKIEVSKRAIDVATLYSQILDNKKEFKNLLNKISLITNYTLSDNEDFLPLVIVDKNKINYFEDTANAKVIVSQIKAKKAEISLIEKEFLPNLNFYSKYDAYGYDKDNYRQSIDDMRKNSYKFGLNLSFNIFNGFKSSSQRQKAILQLKQLQSKYNFEKDKFDSEIRNINQSYELEKVNYKNKSKALEFALENDKNNLKLNYVGEVSKMELLNSIVEKIYKEMDYKLNKGRLAYEHAKKTILFEENKCIVP